MTTLNLGILGGLSCAGGIVLGSTNKEGDNIKFSWSDSVESAVGMATDIVNLLVCNVTIW